MATIEIPANAKSLKISKVADEIAEAIKGSQVTIVSTPTGSGKSMLVPYIAYQLSKKRVYCTVPRVVLSTQNAKGANKLIWHDAPFMGAGYMTGRGGDSDNAKVAKCIYISEGSLLARDIIQKLPSGSILVIDEVHEMGLNLMAVLAATFDILERGCKIVLMSATSDVNDLERYYAKYGHTVSSVVMEASERMFPLEEMVVEDLIETAVNAAIEGGRILWFESGKDEINTAINKMKESFEKKGIKFDSIFPYHSELEEEEEKKIFSQGPIIIVATNILQSGVTIPDITHVYSCGMGKRMQNIGGITKLTPYRLSKAELKQCWGRGGRTCPSYIITTQQDKDVYEYREDMPTPEILRIPLEDGILAFGLAGLDIRNARLYKMPPADEIQRALGVLNKLDLFSDGRITDLGMDVARTQGGFRESLLSVLLEGKGMGILAEKLLVIKRYGHPFRNAGSGAFKSVKGEANYMAYTQWIYVIDGIIEKYGYVPKMADFVLFKSFCEESHLFMKSLTKIMRAFERIDKKYDYDMPSEKEAYESFAYALPKAYADCSPMLKYRYVADGCPFLKRPDVPEGYTLGSYGEEHVVGRTLFAVINYVLVKE